MEHLIVWPQFKEGGLLDGYVDYVDLGFVRLEDGGLQGWSD